MITDTITKKDNEPKLRRLLKKIVPLIQLSDMNPFLIGNIRELVYRMEDMLDSNLEWQKRKANP